MDKTIEACRKCKYSLRRFCINKRCEDCEMKNKGHGVCVCALINYDECCPYYEPAEEVNE